MGTQKKATKIRQDQITDAALHLISRYGMKGLSMVRISRQVGLVPSAIYRHFENKEVLVDAVYDVIELKLQANASEAWAAGGTTLEKLHMLLRLNIRMILEFPAIPRMAFGEGIYGTHSGRRARVLGIVQAFIARIREVVEAGQKSAEIRPDVPAQMVATAFWGLIPPAALLWSASQGQIDIAGLAEEEWSLFREVLSSHKVLAEAKPPADGHVVPGKGPKNERCTLGKANRAPRASHSDLTAVGRDHG